MTDTEIKLILGGLLHDIGKVIYCPGADQRKHSCIGYDFLKHETGLKDDEQKEILEAVRYHHADQLKKAEIEKDSFAYIIYAADHIASAADRKKDHEKEAGFEIHMPLRSIFNRLNGNQKELYYEPKTLNTAGQVNYLRMHTVALIYKAVR